MNIEKLKTTKPMRYWNCQTEAHKQKVKQGIINGDYILTKKYDGYLYRAIKDGDGKLILQSRNISRATKTFTEKQDNVPAIMRELDQIMPKNSAFVGEITFLNPKKTSSDITSIMGCLPSKSIERQKDTPVFYKIFDILFWNGNNISALPYHKRLQQLKSIDMSSNQFVKLVEVVEDPSEINHTLQEWLKQDWEGGVLMLKSSEYIHGGSKRVYRSVKIKQSLQDTLDLLIIGVEPPTRQYNGKYIDEWQYWENLKTGEVVKGDYHTKVGYEAVSYDYFHKLPNSVKLGIEYGGKVIPFGKVSGLEREFKIKLRDNLHNYVNNTVLEVSAMSVDKHNYSLRHPKIVRVRDDKNATDITKWEEL